MTRSPAESGARALPRPAPPPADLAADVVDGTLASPDSRPPADTALAHTVPATAPSDDDDPSPPDETVRLWLTRRDRLFVGTLAAAMLALMLVHWARLSGWGMQPIEIEHLQPRAFDYKIDINTANWVEWAQLEGVGEVLAERIVADREQNGPFQNIDELRRVKGIGPKTLDKLRPWLKCDMMNE
jgi:competence protein ComEA